MIDELTTVQWVALIFFCFLLLEMPVMRYRRRARRRKTDDLVQALNFYLSHEKSREMPLWPRWGGISFCSVLETAIAALTEEEVVR